MILPRLTSCEHDPNDGFMKGNYPLVSQPVDPTEPNPSNLITHPTQDLRFVRNSKVGLWRAADCALSRSPRRLLGCMGEQGPMARACRPRPHAARAMLLWLLGPGLLLTILLPAEAAIASECTAKPRRLEPQVKAYIHANCKSKHVDFPEVGVLLWRPADPGAIVVIQRAMPRAEIIALFDGEHANLDYKRWKEALSGTNHFIVFAKKAMSQVEAFDRLMKLTQAKTALYLGSDFRITDASIAWLKRMRRSLKSTKGAGVFAASDSSAFARDGFMKVSELQRDGIRTPASLSGPFIVDRESMYTKGAVGGHKWCFNSCGIGSGLWHSATKVGLKVYTEKSDFAFAVPEGPDCNPKSKDVCDGK